MIDVIRNAHVPLYAINRTPGSRRSLYWGIGLAALLHLLLAWYLIHQTFEVAAPEPSPPTPNIGLTFEAPTPPPPDRPHPVVNRIVPHDTPLPPPILQTTPIDPQVRPLTQTGPVLPPIIDNSAASSSAATSSGPAYVTPHWKQFPDGDALASYYPPRALDNEIEGVSTVECTVLDAKGRISCQAISESPTGYGFGSATAHMVQERGRIDTSQGDIRIGARLRTTVRWTLN